MDSVVFVFCSGWMQGSSAGSSVFTWAVTRRDTDLRAPGKRLERILSSRAVPCEVWAICVPQDIHSICRRSQQRPGARVMCFNQPLMWASAWLKSHQLFSFCCCCSHLTHLLHRLTNRCHTAFLFSYLLISASMKNSSPKNENVLTRRTSQM